MPIFLKAGPGIGMVSHPLDFIGKNILRSLQNQGKCNIISLIDRIHAKELTALFGPTQKIKGTFPLKTDLKGKVLKITRNIHMKYSFIDVFLNNIPSRCLLYI